MQAGFYLSIFCMKVILKYKSSSAMANTITFAAITGPAWVAKAYTNQTMVLVTTINIIQILKSPTLLVCQALYTWGIKVIADRNAPK